MFTNLLLKNMFLLSKIGNRVGKPKRKSKRKEENAHKAKVFL